MTLGRSWKPALSFLLCLGITGLACHAEQRVQTPLDSGWEFRQHIENAATQSSTWRPAQVPGDVHLDLLHNKLIPDPFYRDNEAKLQWIENASWEYRKTITATPQLLAHDHVDLVFEGLDAACDVYVNGNKIASPDNMFREWRLDVKSSLKSGNNELLIVFPPPLKAAQAVAEKDPYFPKLHAQAKTYIRKAAYEYGWDWGPRFVTSGIWRPAYLETWDEARIENVYVHELDVAQSVAHLDVRTEIIATHAGPADLQLTYGLPGTPTHIERQVTLAEGLNHLDIPVEIDHPSLWYPAGYGAQPIYHFQIDVNVAGKKADTAEAKAGLRTIVLRRDLDKWGRSFEFDVNGIPVFAKGADVIPFDSFPSRVTTEQYRHILQSAKDANMNMIRHWGGGYYETQEFYDICDELGLMVWQDMMFGNDWQPGAYSFKQEIEREAEYQIRRLRNHPSIVLWSGNNETELLRDWNGNGSLSPALHEHIWTDYLTEFSGILARTAARLDPETPYWPSSPSADYEDVSDTWQSGDNHDWTVWHGNADFAEYEKRPWRFVSEYGFQSFPEMKTVESFTLPEDRTSIFTPVMLAHQKNNEGNKIIHDYMTRYYGEPKDFPSFLYASQVLQAEGVKVGAESFRRKRPETMGSIYWQLNDCWPVASWASIDYAGRWKALQYYARRFYAPVLVSPHVENGSLAIYIVSDKTQEQQGQLHIAIESFDGKIVHEVTQPVSISPLSSKIVLQIPLSELKEQGSSEPIDLTKVFATADLTIDGHLASSNLAYFAPTKQIKLPETKVKATLLKAATGYDLELQSPVLARSVYVSFDRADATYSDNYVDILPGKTVKIHIDSTASLEDLQSQMKVISLVDAFQP
jgi:beta-mannosidase